jgi:dihydroorotate dehydrogenase (NAD+) catalytic subunit
MFDVTIGETRFSSLILNASGTFNPPLFASLMSLPDTLGAIVTKTVTPEPKMGNPLPRTVELPGVGMLNSIGLQNPGLAAALQGDLPKYASLGVPVVLSISAGSCAQFAAMAEAVLASEIAERVCALELNLSCPNVEAGGVHFGSSPVWVREVVGAVKAVWPKLIFTKLTPNVSDIVAIGGAAIEAGSTGLTAINTVLGVAIDVKRRKPALPRVSAGYSGPGIKPIALHAIWQLHRHFPQTPIVGVGGLQSAEDVLEFLMAGASMVQVGTSCFRHPMVFTEIQQSLRAFAEAEGIVHLSQLVGCAHESASALVK